MNQPQQVTLQVLNAMSEHNLPTAEAAGVLGISERHARRLRAAFRKKGAAVLVHGNRGHKAPNAVSETTAARVVALAGGKYAGRNHSQITELLAEREGIHLSRKTVSRLLNRSDLVRSRRHRASRDYDKLERRAREGQLLQISAIHYPWLEERGDPLVLLLAVDDATDTVTNAVFRGKEDIRGYFLLMEGVIRDFGIPMAIFSDRHGLFQFSDNQLRTPQPSDGDQFIRAMGGLGIGWIHTGLPQPPGWVKRMAGTFEDHLVDELRLRKVGTVDRANAELQDLLPHLNAKVRVPAQQPLMAYRQMDSSISLERILCFNTLCQVTRDNTVEYQLRTLRLLPNQEWPGYAGAGVEVLERSDGQILIQRDGEVIFHREESPRRPGALWNS